MNRPQGKKPSQRQATRTEYDSLGAIEVPRSALYGAQTERARQNFQFSALRLPRALLRALALLKVSAAETNAELGQLEPTVARAIARAALEVAGGDHDAQFPVDVFQTGSGTSSHMNMNEVVAHLATAKLGKPVHPNDHVNLGQSSNDVFPTALLVASASSLHDELLPALLALESTIDARARELTGVVKTGRTHLMDAMPLTLGQELSGWSAQIRSARERLLDGSVRLRQLPWGGTAVGTGINADPRFAKLAIARLSMRTGLEFTAAPNLFQGLSSCDSAVELAGHLNTLATSLYKITSDLRWMNSGPLAGLGEIELPALQPGSSIMPGKVNPVIPEAVAMIAAQVLGNGATVTFAGASGNFQLNVMLPIIAHNLLESLQLLTRGSTSLGDLAIAGFRVRKDQLDAALSRNPILVTALNPVIGYEASASLAKQAYREGRPILDVALEATELPKATLLRLLDPLALTRGGVPQAKPAAPRGAPAKSASPRQAAAPKVTKTKPKKAATAQAAAPKVTKTKPKKAQRRR